ncbi:MAG: DUF3870 domain-containing protein [Dehalobacterium sp.]
MAGWLRRNNQAEVELYRDIIKPLFGVVVIKTKTVVLIGHAAFPQGMAAKGLYDHLSIVTEIDRVHGVVVNVECNLITNLANNFIYNLLKGYSLEDGVDSLISEVISTYHGAARNAIIASLKDLERKYIKYKTE